MDPRLRHQAGEPATGLVLRGDDGAVSGTAPRGLPRTGVVDDEEFLVIGHQWRTPAIVEIDLVPALDPVPFLPGQYVLLGDPDYQLPVRSYSVANAPRPDGRLTFLVTAVSGGRTSRWLTSELRRGNTVLVSGPYGAFTAPRPQDRPILALAGGSGWAPIRALAHDAVTRGLAHSFTVLLSARTERDEMDADLLARWRQDDPRFEFAYTLTRESTAALSGRIPAVLPTIIEDLSTHEVFIAGAPSLVTSCAQAARQLGATPGRVHTEEYYSDPVPWA